MLRESDFAIAPAKPLELAKEVQCDKQVGIMDDRECLDNDIVCCTTVVELVGKDT